MRVPFHPVSKSIVQLFKLLKRLISLEVYYQLAKTLRKHCENAHFHVKEALVV